MAPRKPAKKATRKKAATKKPEPPTEVSPEELANGEPDAPETEAAPANVNFDALQEFADSVVAPGSDTPRAASSHIGDGDPYVRMLNTRGDPIAVSYRLVPDRIMDGYNFIEGEPCIPIMSTSAGRHQDIPECMYDNPNAKPSPRHQPKDIRHNKLALQVWFGHMRDDMATMRDRTDLDWEYLRRVGEMIAGLPDPS